VTIDPRGDLIAVIHHDLGAGALARQAAEAPVPAALRALRQLASEHPAAPQTGAALEIALGSDRFWGLRAEAARLAGGIRLGDRAKELIDRALLDPDYRVRKAAVLASGELRTGAAAERLRAVVEADDSGDVVATAVAVLADLSPPPSSDFLRTQLERDSWHDEVRIAALRAIGDSGIDANLDQAKKYASDRYNEDVRRAALRAWRWLAPGERAAGTPPSLQGWAITALGELGDSDAVPVLEEIARLDFDPNFTWSARSALAEIRRLDAGAGAAPATNETGSAFETMVTPKGAPAMEPRISLVTLGVGDLERSIRFYRDGLGLPMRPDTEGVAFFETRGTWLGLFPRVALAEDAEVTAAGEGFPGFSLAHNVRTRDEVDALLAAAARAGAKIVKPAADTSWGGYSGYFADPDGFLWEVAWNPHFWVGGTG
jgi:catechol 2,3-dioxygenase-like lactoylglutathione lyase family enzyme/HEAT repeat protein